MVTHILDTSVYSQRLKRTPHPGVIRRWKALGDASLAISSVCEAELLFGLQKLDSERLWLEYELYLQDRLVMIPLGREEVAEYAKIKVRLMKSGQITSDFDMLIGATARANSLILVTLNFKHFNKIEGLAVEDWSLE